MTRLRVESAAFSYCGAARPAVCGVSLELAAGQVAAVVGANGSGKSTLLGLASGRLRPASGRVLVDGRDASDLPPAARASRIAALPQTERVAFDFSCLDFVLFARAHARSPFAAPSAEDAALSREALRSLGVGALEGRPVTELSGGELQLVRLARCVAQGSGLLVLDEPTAMLDPAHTLAVARAVRSIAESGAAVILATHDLAFAAAVADRGIVLKAGGGIAAGEGARVFALPVLAEAFGTDFELRPVPVPRGF